MCTLQRRGRRRDTNKSQLKALIRANRAVVE